MLGIFRLLKLGNGTTWPGLFFEKLFPSAISKLVTMDSFVILITGTNGKTTVRSMLVKAYEDKGLVVCSNRGGANIYRGVATALLNNFDWLGKPKTKTIILEVEEATMPRLTQYIKPNKIVLTNIFRDQLDAYGEIDATLNFFRQSFKNLHNYNHKYDLIINQDDQKLLTVLDSIGSTVNLIGFGVEDSNLVLPDYELTGGDSGKKVDFDSSYCAKNITSKNLQQSFDLFETVQGSKVQAKIASLKSDLMGVYNVYNLVASYATCCDNLGLLALDSLEKVGPVFGRGEKVRLNNGSELIMLLVKNPAGMNQVFDLIKNNFEQADLGLNFLINDNIADGRDVSWLWDCNFETLKDNFGKVQYRTSGSRSMDMLLRLETAGVQVSLDNSFDSIEELVKTLNSSQSVNKINLVLATYTAMLEFRNSLSKTVELEGINSSGN